MKKIICVILLISILAISSAVLVSAASNDSISYNDGGTLYLNYTGETSLNGYTTYSRIVYFSPEQTVFLQNAICGDTIKDILLSAADGIITEQVVQSIATAIGVPYAKLVGLLAFSVSVLIDIIQAFDSISLTEAINNSTTAKVKYVCFTYYNPLSGEVVPVKTFHAWNDNVIEIPDNHEYAWLPDIYHYDSANTSCAHTLSTYTDAGPYYHVRWCNKCAYTEKARHQYGTWFSISGSKHQTNCVTCGHAKTGYHKDSYDLILGKCTLCGHVGMIQLKQKMHLFDA